MLLGEFQHVLQRMLPHFASVFTRCQLYKISQFFPAFFRKCLKLTVIKAKAKITIFFILKRCFIAAAEMSAAASCTLTCQLRFETMFKARANGNWTRKEATGSHGSERTSELYRVSYMQRARRCETCNSSSWNMEPILVLKPSLSSWSHMILLYTKKSINLCLHK